MDSRTATVRVLRVATASSRGRDVLRSVLEPIGQPRNTGILVKVIRLPVISQSWPGMEDEREEQEGGEGKTFYRRPPPYGERIMDWRRHCGAGPEAHRVLLPRSRMRESRATGASARPHPAWPGATRIPIAFRTRDIRSKRAEFVRSREARRGRGWRMSGRTRGRGRGESPLPPPSLWGADHGLAAPLRRCP